MWKCLEEASVISRSHLFFEYAAIAGGDVWRSPAQAGKLCISDVTIYMPCLPDYKNTVSFVVKKLSSPSSFLDEKTICFYLISESYYKSLNSNCRGRRRAIQVALWGRLYKNRFNLMEWNFIYIWLSPKNAYSCGFRGFSFAVYANLYANPDVYSDILSILF